MGRGSMRRRGRDAWELRVYVGTDPATRRQRFAQGQLSELAEEAGYARLRAGKLSDLFEVWFEAVSPAVHWEAGAIAFTRALVQGPNGPELRPTKTHRTHRADLDRGTLEVLRSHRARAETRASGDGVNLADDSFVFSSEPDGRSPATELGYEAIIAHRRAAGLESFRLHDLRLFMATQMLAAGVPIATVAQWLNHAPRVHHAQRLRSRDPGRRPSGGEGPCSPPVDRRR